tara:strand:+ start:549 stop:1022 length:474 start_codon:yes stop_codon:yes gene_type:complete
MTTNLLNKTEIKATWDLEKIQELNARGFANTMMAAMEVLGKHGEEAMKEFQAKTREPMVKMLKEMGVKTPIELVKAKAEYETNLFGSKIEIHGDEKEAHLTYLSCAMWNNMKTCLTKEQQEGMGECWQACVSAFAKEFGFTGEVKMEGEIATIIFRK